VSRVCDQEDRQSSIGIEDIRVGGMATEKTYPTKSEVLAVIPVECFERSLTKSALSLLVSLTMTIGSGVLAYACIPITWTWLPAWIAYAVICGTVGTGCWVVAHECGHRAFTKHNWLQDVIGFCLHSGLLVPYFSWQRSHAVHHARTNHIDLGETFVPLRDTTASGKAWLWWNRTVGDEAFAILSLFRYFLIGWPVYLMTGATGGPARGLTNHFWPIWPFSAALFPGTWRLKVWISDIGILAMLGILAWWTRHAGFVTVLAVYIGPYLVVNFWLVLYTWLQHTDVDIPHFEDEDWTWIKGAFMTVDRPYGVLLDFLHHRIGSTHVAHHIDARIPHYNAAKATRAIQRHFPDFYRYDPTPIPQALWRIATHCIVVTKTDDGWRFCGRSRHRAGGRMSRLQGCDTACG
jgi:fatty acid desaturase